MPCCASKVTSTFTLLIVLLRGREETILPKWFWVTSDAWNFFVSQMRTLQYCVLGNVWLNDVLCRSPALRVCLPSWPLLSLQPSSVQWFSCCFFLPLLWSCRIQRSLLSVPFGWCSLWLNKFRFSLLFLCLLPLRPRRPSATDQRGKTRQTED